MTIILNRLQRQVLCALFVDDHGDGISPRALWHHATLICLVKKGLIRYEKEECEFFDHVNKTVYLTEKGRFYVIEKSKE